MRVLVTGGRHYTDRELVFRVLTELDAEGLGITHLAHGASPYGSPERPVGADWLADAWALENALVVGDTLLRYPADWAHYGPAAGPIRIVQMFELFRPELVVAFPGERGTARTVIEATRRKVEIRSEPRERLTGATVNR